MANVSDQFFPLEARAEITILMASNLGRTNNIYKKYTAHMSLFSPSFITRFLTSLWEITNHEEA